jgi:hypothetical protein
MRQTLLLLATSASGPLIPATLAQALARVAAESGALGAPPAPRGAMRGQVLRLAKTLLTDDEAAAGFMLEFIGQGRLVSGSAIGPSGDLLAWGMHALAARVPCTLRDEEDDATLDPDPGAHLDAAMAYLVAYEAEVREDRALPSIRRPSADANAGARFVRWLAREEHLALASQEDEAVDALGGSLALADASAVYEALLDSEAIDEVFVSETELTTLLARFRARASGAPVLLS